LNRGSHEGPRTTEEHHDVRLPPECSYTTPDFVTGVPALLSFGLWWAQSRPGSSHALKTAFGESVRIIGQCSARKELQYVIFKTSVDLEQLHS
jgi:hypothetical protein